MIFGFVCVYYYYLDSHFEIFLPGAASTTRCTSGKDCQAGGELMRCFPILKMFYQNFTHFLLLDAGEEIGDTFASWNL